ncbi:MAG TPA: hypothetical protein VN521_10525 [Negativicutes bacterium]|nr:hypothetical protein [Negativicutes bacterium]
MMLDYLLFALAAFLFGYFLGKRLGREEGREEGKALARLILREKSFALGYCALCRTPSLPREREMA